MLAFGSCASVAVNLNGLLDTHARPKQQIYVLKIWCFLLSVYKLIIILDCISRFDIVQLRRRFDWNHSAF